MSIPDFCTLSLRSKGPVLPSAKCQSGTRGLVHLVIDSTGLKVFGEREWLENKHHAKATSKRWRKLHLGLDLESSEIVCVELTTDDIGDPTALPDRLDQIDGPITRFIADSAYDDAPSRDPLAARLGEIVDLIIPPPKNAVASLTRHYRPRFGTAISPR